ncbi:hypothetical protein ALC57_15348 [Trachymyrmex cornetzi]|uniref:Uncharacterized protein n=1 Tax=Trachymyrmex cornetzi TaxID=471704 RepID=A0A195DIA1_9HYME|nr:hypothetical protein ALC57_15348 [Trachymyrmex cornetzi]
MFGKKCWIELPFNRVVDWFLCFPLVRVSRVSRLKFKELETVRPYHENGEHVTASTNLGIPVAPAAAALLRNCAECDDESTLADRRRSFTAPRRGRETDACPAPRSQIGQLSR